MESSIGNDIITNRQIFIYSQIKKLSKTVIGHLHDTLHTSTCFHQRSKKRPTARRQSAGNLRQSDSNLPAIYGNLIAICRILPYFAKSNESYQVLPGPLLKSYPTLYTCQLSNKTNNIYPFSPFPYLLSLYNVLTLLRSLCTQLNNIYFAIYYHRLYSLRDTTLC